MQLKDFINKHNLPELDLTKSQNVWHSITSDTFKGGYRFREVQYKDAKVTVVSVHNWKTGESITERFGAESLTDAQSRAIGKIIKAEEEAALEEKKRKHEETKTYANTQYPLSEETRPSNNAYLKRKGLGEVPYTIRTRKNMVGQPELVLPMYSFDRQLWNYQTITDNGEKQIIIGGRMQGLFIPITPHGSDITDFSNYDRVYICEGFSTGLSIFLALDQKVCVLCAISSNNIYNVVREFRRAYERTPYIICADNDCWKRDQENSGERAASECVSRIDGGSYVLPNFSRCSAAELTSKPTDYNDLLVLCGSDEVRRQIGEATVNRPHVVYPLGYDGKSFFFVTSRVTGIEVLTEFSETELLRLGSKEYWTARFPDDRGRSFILQDIKSDLIAKCQRVGIFDMTKVRGKGVYKEPNTFIINTGDKLIDVKTGSEVFWLDVTGKNVYSPQKNPKTIVRTPYDAKLMPNIYQAIQEFAWQDRRDAIMLFGWMIVSPISGCLDWRPHVGITSEAGTGKSTLLKAMSMTLRYFSPQYSTGITEAGLRQDLGANSVPVILDEVDTNSTSEKSFNNLMSLFRMASSGGEVVKGTPTGRALRYVAQFSGLIAGINFPHMNHADRTRFCILNMSRNSTGSWADVQKRVEILQREETAAQFAEFILSNVSGILARINEFMPIVELAYDARTAQQYGALLGAASYALGMSVEEALEHLKGYDSREELAEKVKGSNDTEECLEWLLDMPVFVDNERIKIPLRNIVEGHEKQKEILYQFGMREVGGKLFVPNTNIGLRSHFKDTPWLAWNKTLARVQGVEKRVVKHLGHSVRGLILPLEVKQSPEPKF